MLFVIFVIFVFLFIGGKTLFGGRTAVEKVNVGVVGCGAISTIYLKNLTTVFSRILQVTCCSDLIASKAQDQADKFPGVKAVSVEQLLADRQVELIVNLTIPNAHAEVALRAVQAGKSVYNEKPLTITRDQARQLLAAAQKNNVLVGCAPDTFLGAGYQTCRKLVEEGRIGRPIAANANFLCRGHERWHPSPEFYYKKGGGPMFDMGPYYLTALVSLLGPVARVCGSAVQSFPTRTITSQPLAGKTIEVEVPTHVAGVMEFACGTVATIVTSFDVWASQAPRMELHGSEASLVMPDPNTFGGKILLRPAADKEWQEIPLAYGYAENSRGLGVADLARALRTGRAARAGGELAYHVLDLMHAFHDAAAQRASIELESSCAKPAPLPLGLAAGDLD